MKTPTTLLFLSALLCIRVFAIEWEVIGQDSRIPVHSGNTEVNLVQSLGQITVKIFDSQKIPYLGNEAGMNSILGTPTGDKLLVVVNNDSMRAYGWCFQVDGKIPDLMPDKFYFAAQKAKLTWFFAFSLYEKGQWTQYCVPAYTIPLKND